MRNDDIEFVGFTSIDEMLILSPVKLLAPVDYPCFNLEDPSLGVFIPNGNCKVISNIISWACLKKPGRIIFEVILL